MAESLINTERIDFAPGNFQADLAQSVGTRKARASGMPLGESMLAGFQARQSTFDPLFEIKKINLQTEIMGRAQQFQQNILSNKIRQKQIDDEAADDLASADIIQRFGGRPPELLNALNSTYWKSARGIQNAIQMRLQLSELLDMDEASQIYSKLDGIQRAALVGLKRGSPEWVQAIRKLPQSQAAGSLEVDSRWLAGIRATGDANAIAQAEQQFATKYPRPEDRAAAQMNLIGEREKSGLRKFYSEEIAKLDSEAAALERSNRPSDIRDAEGLRAQARSFQDKLSNLSKPESPAAMTESQPATNALPKVSSQADVNDAIRQANEAIKKGKDPKLVRERLKQMGITLNE